MFKRILPLAALPFLLTACGGSDGSGKTSAAQSDLFVKYAQCMRQNGVPEWPDPIDGDKYRFKMGTVDPKSPQFKAAQQKCKELAPPGWDGKPTKQDPAQQAKMLKYAQCIRKNGVPNFPDPQGGQLDPGNIDLDSPQFKAADETCKDLRPAGAGG
ncbi:hypothetical protein [Actinomadura rayongensis]|uniref:Lipoprotein n=1 Tax=Actinomadura rayongensis TaxID=1429076 RepID=A0A6I4W4W2_9ACTN|nr:hypothetical protein [Actinomadura rayongensis]MXQ65227.1 hypothetical protein [Actinomadura rayongensis]